MIAPRHLLLALGLFLILADVLATANADVEASEQLLEKILPEAARGRGLKKCKAGCNKKNKPKSKCKVHGGYCVKKRKNCGAGEKFNSNWCKGYCGCCYKEFEPLKCHQTAECKTHNGTVQDTRLNCNGGDEINQYSNSDGCTCCVKTVKPLINYNKDSWSQGIFTGLDGRTMTYTTAPYSWHSCQSWCGENDASQANVTDLAYVAKYLNDNEPGKDWWTTGCGGVNGCADFRPRYYPSVSCFDLKCSYHQGCLCVKD